MKTCNKLRDRRKLVSLLALSGSALIISDKWLKPVVNAVVLPAHAQTSETPVMAVLEGVVDGEIATRFTVDASASLGPIGAVLSYSFSVDMNCILISQSGATAIVERGLVNGDCMVSVTVSDGTSSDTESATANVTGGPPGTP